MPKSKHRKKHKERVVARRHEAATHEAEDSELPVPSRADLEAYAAAMPAEERADALLAAELMLDRVFDTEIPEQQVELISEALSTAPLCSRGYLMLTTMVDAPLDEVIPLYRTAFDAAELSAGGLAEPGSLTEEHDEYLWALTAYAEALWATGDGEGAIDLLRRAQRQAGDNDLGLQYMLAPWLAELGHVEELAALLARYPEDDGLDWTLNRALLAYLQEGDTEATRARLAAAAGAYPDAVEALLDEIEVWQAYQDGEPPEQEDHPEAPEAAEDDPGAEDAEDDARPYALRAATAWANIPGALDWLFRALGIDQDELE
jgi:hypothetical protein